METTQIRSTHRLGARARGVTLVECCIAVGIVGVLASQAVPSLDTWTDQQRLTGRANEVAQDIYLMKSTAVMKNQALRLRVYTDDSGSCYVLQAGDDAACSCTGSGALNCPDPTRPPLRSAHFPATDGVTLSSNVKTLTVDSRLGTFSPGATLKIGTTEGREIRHIVNIMGRVRSCSWPQASGSFSQCT